MSAFEPYLRMEPWVIYLVGFGISGLISGWRYFERQGTQSWPEVEGTVEQYRMIVRPAVTRDMQSSGLHSLIP